MAPQYHSYLQSTSVLTHLQCFGTLGTLLQLSDVSSTETLFKTCCFFCSKIPAFLCRLYMDEEADCYVKRKSEWNAINFYIIWLYIMSLVLITAALGESKIKKGYGKFSNPLFFKYALACLDSLFPCNLMKECCAQTCKILFA